MIHFNDFLSARKQLRLQQNAKENLIDFIKYFWPVIEIGNPYVHNWHIDAISEHLEAVTYGEINRLVINVPPGLMKSIILNVFWPAWEWGQPELTQYKYLSCSHKQNLSIRDNNKMRQLITSEKYQELFPHVIIKKDENSKIKFVNTANGFKEAMPAGSITGSRGDRVNIDDPISVDDAESKIILGSRMLWFTESVPTRLINPKESSIIVIMQRLKDLDTTGIILSRELNYEHLMLPMEFEPQRKCFTSIGFEDPRTEEGELLFPERFPQWVVDRDKKTLGAVAIAAQNQQRPIPREGSIIKVDWLQKRFKLMRNNQGQILLTEFTEIIQSYDTAFKEGEQNDFNVCLTWGLKDDGYYLINMFKERLNFPALEQSAIESARFYKPNQILIEDKASGQSLIQALKRRTNLPIRAVNPDRDKVARLHAVSGYYEAGRIILPDNEPWVQNYIDTLTTFPACAHDDEVDASSQFLLEIALRRESKNGVRIRSVYGR